MSDTRAGMGMLRAKRLLVTAGLVLALLALPAIPAAAKAAGVAQPRTFAGSVASASQQDLLAGSSRRSQGGWLLVRLQGTPYQIGYQRGYLTADATDYWLRNRLGPRGGQYRLRSRVIARTYVWPKIPPEYRLELKGTAAGLRARGSKADLWDIVAANQWADQSVYSSGHANSATGGCSAFIATGRATADGQIVMGHDTWTSYDRGSVENVLYDVHPAKGHAFRYQGCGGAIWSGEDWYVNDAGLMVCETSLQDAAVDPKGLPVFVRVRRGVQYASSVDGFISIMLHRNNGAYPNEWLVGDAKTGEIASLQLGCKAHDLKRTQSGFFGSSNYATGADFRREAHPPPPSPAAPSVARFLRWRQLSRRWHGKVDATVGKTMLADHYDTYLKRARASSRTMCGHFEADAYVAAPYGAIDGKVTTSSMVLNGMQMWARWGHACGTRFDAHRWMTAHPGWARAHGALSVAGLQRFSAETPNRWSLVKEF